MNHPNSSEPFPLGHQRRRGKVVFGVNEEAAEFCKGLGKEEKSEFEKLSKAALAMDKEQKTFKERVRLWNSNEIGQKGAHRSMDDLLKFLLPNNRNIHKKTRNMSIQ